MAEDTTWGAVANRVGALARGLRAAGRDQLADDLTDLLVDSCVLGTVAKQSSWWMQFTIDRPPPATTPERTWFEDEEIVYTMAGPVIHFARFTSGRALARAYHRLRSRDLNPDKMGCHTWRTITYGCVDIAPADLEAITRA